MNRKERRIAQAQGKPKQAGESGISLQPDTKEMVSKALAFQQAGNLNKAENICKIILQTQPRNADAWSLLGTIQLQRGNLDDSLSLFDRAIASNPNHSQTYNNRGIVLGHLKRYGEALANYTTLIALSPGYANAYKARGNILSALQHYDEAMADYDKALALNPIDAGTLNNRGCTLSQLERYAEALVSLNTSIVIEPNNANTYSNRGIALTFIKRYNEALKDFDKAIALNPAHSEAYSNRSNVLNKLKNYDEALASANKAIALKPDYAEAYNNRGTALDNLQRYDEALTSFDKAIELNPEYSDALLNRSSVCTALNRYAEALAGCDRVIARDAQHAQANFSKAFLLLMQGKYEEGWKLFEWRWKIPDSKWSPPTFHTSLWLGKEPLAGKTILLRAEQGLGDTIQFCRYAPLVEALGAKVILEVQPPLAGVVSSLSGEHEIIKVGDPLPPFDYYSPLMSLPLALGTTLNTIPSDIPYLYASGDKRRFWQQRLGPKAKPRIGLVWSGGPMHKNDHKRSISLKTLLPLLECDAEFHCLQKDVREADTELLAQSAILSYGENVNDFSDTAALIMGMDVVISVDTSVAHLAGALGKAVWVLLPSVPDYRWLLEREDSPWYPTARLFRQQSIGDWQSVIEKVKLEVKLHYES